MAIDNALCQRFADYQESFIDTHVKTSHQIVILPQISPANRYLTQLYLNLEPRVNFTEDEIDHCVGSAPSNCQTFCFNLG